MSNFIDYLHYIRWAAILEWLLAFEVTITFSFKSSLLLPQRQQQVVKIKKTFLTKIGTFNFLLLLVDIIFTVANIYQKPPTLQVIFL